MSRIIIASLVLFVGCATSRKAETRYDPATGATTYRSTKVLVGNIDPSFGLVSGQRVSMQAIASCPAEGCRPPQVELTFLNDSSRDMSLDYRRVQIRFDERKLEWEDLARTEPAHYMVPRGEFIRVPVSWSDFNEMAHAATVQVIFGTTGTRILTIPHVKLAPLRQLLEEVKGQAVSET